MKLGHNFFARVEKASSARFIRTTKSASPTTVQSSTVASSLFNYTSGRWLWNERAQLDARYCQFDVPRLQQIACEAVGAKQCISLEKIGEGNYNKAYRLTFEDGQKVIAKIPHPNAGPLVLTTMSEVATMEFARTILNVPVPKVLAWNGDSNNPVDAEFIIMEEAKGSPLHQVWEQLQLRPRRDIIHEIVNVEQKLLSVSFNKSLNPQFRSQKPAKLTRARRLGSLYLAGSDIPGCEPAVTTNGSQEVRDRIKSRFCVGPIVRKKFWEKKRKDLHQYHGPWESSVEYLMSVVRHKTIEYPGQYTSAAQRSPEAHRASLHKLSSAIPSIVPKDPELVSPRIWHPDLHAGNIYVNDQGQISSIIDWQGAWTSPVFLGANPPLLLDYGIDMLMKLPDNFKQLDEATKDQLRYQVGQSILIHSYETLTAEKNPVMHKMMRYPHSQTLKQLEAFAGSTWDNCLYPLQECLIRVEREWEHFGADVPCPYHFTEEEVREHETEADSFNENQELWDKLRGVLTDEGYTSNETFGEAVKMLEDLQESQFEGPDGKEE